MEKPQKEGKSPTILASTANHLRKANIFCTIGPSFVDASTIGKMLGMMFSSTSPMLSEYL
jgi:hypothetical protein